MKKFRHCKTWQRNAVAVAVASCFVIASPVYANPIGADVASGVVSMAQQGNTLNITNSPGAIINWQSFSIGANEATRFIQQSAASGVLNRVTGVDPSSILGALQSNGRVFLINPNGVLFGAGAQVDVAGLIVSTLNLSNADFLNGRYNFTTHAGAGSIENQGNLTALPGGQIYLVAPGINNSGLITSPQGDILLAAGASVELVNASSPDMRVVISAPDNQAVNLGSIVANSGRIGIYAGLINHHGIVSADTAIVGATGKITFKATKDINLEPGSVISASGASGGVHDGGEVRIIADGKLAMRQGSEVHVDGGVDGGNGGFLELSGKHVLLDGSFSIAARANGFHGGTLLIDPINFSINSVCTGGSSCMTPTAINTALSGGGTVNILADSNISVDSYVSGGTGQGGLLSLTAGNDINVNQGIGLSGARFNHDLTLTAGNDVNINNSIYLGNNTLTLTADAAIPTGLTSPIAKDGLGDVLVTPTLNNNSVTVDTLGNIFINAASLTVSGGSASAAGESGSQHADATLHAGGALGITVTNGVTVQGGTASASASFSSAQATATANATISAGSLTLLANGLTIRGGGAHAQAGTSSSAINRSAEAQAKALVSVGTVTELTLGNGGLSISGGTGSGSPGTTIVSGSGGSNTALSDRSALLEVTGSGDVLLTSTGGITIQGGYAQASAGGNGTNTTTGHADAGIQAVGLLHIADASSLTVQGGSASISTSGTGLNNATATAAAKLSAGSMTVNISGNVLLNSGGGLLANAGDIILVAVSDIITLGVNAYIDAGAGNVTLAAVGGNFINNSGSAKPIKASRTLIYSTIPTSDALNGMTADFKRYNCTYAAGCLTAGTTIPATGNGFLYSYAPALAVTAAAQSKIYGAADPAFSYTVSGYEFGDDAATALSGALGRAAGENVGSYAINQGAFLSPLGYIISLTGNNLGITPASLSIIANALSKVYGSADPVLTYTATGFQFSDTTGTVLTGSLSRVAGEVIGLYAINQGSLAANANYTVSYTGNNLSITAAPVDVVQPELNTVLNGTLKTVALPILNSTLLAAVGQSDAQENPLEKKPTYTCQ